jgi:hypothetical protein
MKDWRTTVPAIVATVCGFVLMYPEHFPQIVIDMAKFTGLGGLAAFGINAASLHALNRGKKD